MLTSVLLGAGTGLSLIIAIGAQNAFVLQQGIRREHVLPVVLICGLSDVLLEFFGIAGIGFVIERAPVVLEAIRWGGVAFLLWYAVGAVRRALRPGVLVPAEGDAASVGASGAAGAVSAGGGKVRDERGSQHTLHSAGTLHAQRSLRQTVLACLAITYLNPHVYLDTVVLVGSIGNAQGETGKWWFLLGSGLASVLWFAALGYGARLLTPLFATPRAWQMLDWCIAVTMLVIAARLAFGGIGAA